MKLILLAAHRGIWAVVCGLFLGCSKGGSSAPPAATPQVSINSIAQAEGNDGTRTFTFELTLDQSAAAPVTVRYSVFEGTAAAGTDFRAAVNQQVTLLAGSTRGNLVVEVIGDELREGNEEFTVSLLGAEGATLGSSFGTGIITNDDTRIAIAPTGFEGPAGYAGHHLVWSDEFNAGALNTTDWTVEGGDGCPNLCGWGNGELEYYTGRPENLFFQDGHLVIEARKEAHNGRGYTSSKILTRGKRTFRYGRIDIRAQLPKGRGIWPAFWMLPQREVYGGWPRSGEIDIMEYLGHDTARTYGTVHYGPGPGSTQSGKSYTLSAGSFSGSFHLFSVDWSEDSIRWLVDGVEYHRIARTTPPGTAYPFNEEFFLIFNMAVGGAWPGAPDATTEFPQFLVVDYVRVFQK